MNTQRIGEVLSRLSRDISAIALADVVLWLLIALAVFLLIRLVRRWIDRVIEDVNRRHGWRKAVGYAGVLVVLAVGVALFVGEFGHLATVLGLVGAGLAIALQDVGKSAAGWIYMTSRSGFGPGARVEVDGVLGEVIDIGILKTTVLEVGNIVYGRQSSGRLVSIPNSRFLNSHVRLSPAYSPYVWLEVQFLFTFESDWKQAVELLEGLGAREFADVDRGTREAFRGLEKRYAFKYGARTPVVYVRSTDSGVELTLRFLTHIRQRRGARDRVTRAMLEAVERDPGLDFAYPTMRIYRRGEPPPSESETTDG